MKMLSKLFKLDEEKIENTMSTIKYSEEEQLKLDEEKIENINEIFKIYTCIDPGITLCLPRETKLLKFSTYRETTLIELPLATCNISIDNVVPRFHKCMGAKYRFVVSSAVVYFYQKKNADLFFDKFMQLLATNNKNS